MHSKHALNLRLNKAKKKMQKKEHKTLTTQLQKKNRREAKQHATTVSPKNVSQS